MFALASTLFGKVFSLVSGKVGKYLIYLILAAIIVGGLVYMYHSISAKDAKIGQLQQNNVVLKKQEEQAIQANIQYEQQLAQIQKDNSFLQQKIAGITVSDQNKQIKTDEIIKNLLSKNNENKLKKESHSKNPAAQQKFIKSLDNNVNCMFSSISTGASCSGL